MLLLQTCGACVLIAAHERVDCHIYITIEPWLHSGCEGTLPLMQGILFSWLLDFCHMLGKLQYHMLVCLACV